MGVPLDLGQPCSRCHIDLDTKAIGDISVVIYAHTCTDSSTYCSCPTVYMYMLYISICTVQ